MNEITRLVAAAVIACTAMLSSETVLAQSAQRPASQVAADGGNTNSDLNLAEVEAAQAAMEADSGIEDSVKDLLRTKYQQAVAALQEAASDAAQAAEYRESVRQAPDATAEIRIQLEALPSVEIAGDVAAPANPDDLQEALDVQRANFSAVSEELSDVTSDSSLAEQRPAEISVRIPEAERELADVRRQLASPEVAEDVTSIGRAADRFVLRASELKLLNELDRLEQEQLSQSVRRNLQQLRKQLLIRQVENASAATAAYETLMNRSVTEVARDIGARAEELRLEVPTTDLEAVALASGLQDLAARLVTVVQDKKKISAAATNVTTRRKRLTLRYDSIKKQLELDQPGVEMAQVLIDLRALLNARVREVAQLGRWPTLAQTRLAAVQIDFKIDAQSEVREQFADRSSLAVKELVAARDEVLDKLQKQYIDLVPIQASLDSETRLYLDKAEEIEEGMTHQLFWIRNSPPLSFSTFSEIPNGLQWAFGRDHWSECWGALKIATRRAPVRSGVVVLFAIVLLMMRPQFAAALRRAGDGVGRVSLDRYSLTGSAVMWTGLLALPFPLLVGFVASALTEAVAPSVWLRDFNSGLARGLLVVSAASVISACCYRGGLGDVHFGWRKESLLLLRRGSLWFAFGYVPLALLGFCTLSSAPERFFHSVGRVTFLFLHAWLLVIIARLLLSSHGIPATRVPESATRPVSRWRHLWSILVIMCPLGVIVLAALGYTMTGFNLSYAFVLTLIIIVSGVIFYALVLRWFRIEHRKLAFAEALEKRQARREAAASEEQKNDPQEMISVDEDEQELDLDSVGQQTVSVLKLFIGLGMATAVLSLWSTTLPLIPYLDRIRVPMTVDFTLLELAKAVLVVGITWLIMKNLPGMLELTGLRATSMDNGTRYAIATLCQYAVAFTGFVLLFNVLNLDWASFGWVAGGLSVGIGFGMQEVIANFVCGLILLFERPIRIGDVVTVEGTTGTVTRLHMRATTITNWDRQDFVVPNKTLITGTILNWTLSASLNRILIPVGVAYGTDTEAACRILLGAAADHPCVMDDPAPAATFEQFADSSLNLVLRAYLPDLDNRLGTITELHTEINKRFAAAGIEIAFPQQDIHIRNDSGSAPADSSEIQ